MGFAPEQTDRMSLWEFIACVEGWNRAHHGEKVEPPTEEEFDESMRRADKIFGTMH